MRMYLISEKQLQNYTNTLKFVKANIENGRLPYDAKAIDALEYLINANKELEPFIETIKEG